MIKKLPLKVSSSAVNALQEAGKIYPELPFIRIGIKGGAGCAGVAYSIGVDKSTDKDEIYLYESLKFAIEKGQLMHLVGLSIDYLETEQDSGFTFQNESSE